jgi:hypothetical protein
MVVDRERFFAAAGWRIGDGERIDGRFGGRGRRRNFKYGEGRRMGRL